MVGDTTRILPSLVPRDILTEAVRLDSRELEEMAGPLLQSVLSTHPCIDLADCRPWTPHVSDRMKAEVDSFPEACRGEGWRVEVPVPGLLN